ncbi:MAG: exo-alpha-sialidase [Alloprevotella sp.]|nr:exo-alpha-sialidase [Alloprevotella sp.]
MKKTFSLLAALGFCVAAAAQQVLFHTGDESGFPYRIPAIAKAKNGDLIALSDRRPCGNDIGYGRVDILMRVSVDNGATWDGAEEVLVGTGEGPLTGFGDACLVADRNRNELTLICCSGDVPYWSNTIDHHQGIMVTHARYDRSKGSWRWGEPKDISESFYRDLFGGRVPGMFMGSGRICQSRQVKVGNYYRLYAAMCTHKGNWVVYSDDFGDTWKVLGSAAVSCAPQGDEPKCEELPDGSVLLSSRKHCGRYFNIFKFTDRKNAVGAWTGVVDSQQAEGGISNEGNSCNGEILIVNARRVKGGKKATLALQSMPAGPGRSHVTIYFKDITDPATYRDAKAFAEAWDGSYRVTEKQSAYSTMVQQQDGCIAFLYEEEPGSYQIVYLPLDIRTITGGLYK